MNESNETLKASAGIENLLSDIRVNPDAVGKLLSTKHILIQQRVFNLCISYIRELAIQHETGGYINGNIDLAHNANLIYQTLLDNELL